MAEPTLYLFDGHNLLHAGDFASPAALRDLLASWVAARGVRGVLVFDGHGEDEQHGALEVCWAPHADTLLERLAAEHRSVEQVAIVSSDAVLRGTSGGLAFVFGAEGKGLRPLVRRTCDLEVSISQFGHVESLNVSVAAAVLLYEARRQRDG